MKTARRMTLAQALDEIASVSEEIRSRGTALVDGRAFGLDSLVTLEIESESSGKKAELEFEIRFAPAGAVETEAVESRSGRARPRLLVLGLATLAVALGVIALRRGHDGGHAEASGRALARVLVVRDGQVMPPGRIPPLRSG